MEGLLVDSRQMSHEATRANDTSLSVSSGNVVRQSDAFVVFADRQFDSGRHFTRRMDACRNQSIVFRLLSYGASHFCGTRASRASSSKACHWLAKPARLTSRSFSR